MLHGLQEAKNTRVIYVDMNAFFASIEQQRYPNLRNRPMAVTSYIAPSATIIASSYEAKALGITTGVRVREALMIYPDLKIVETDAPIYHAMHKQFLLIIREIFGPEVHARSIDEAALYLAPNWQNSEKAWELVHQIKQAFYDQLGECIRCSIGIAPNILLAKLATDLQKPNGLVEITLENTAAILEKLELTDLPGIAEKSAANLNRHAIYTPLDLYQTSAVRLKSLFGIWGQYWWWRLHGYEPDGASGPQKTMSHEHVLARWTDKRSQLANTINKMTDRILHRLRKNRLTCRSLSLRLSFKDIPSAQFDHYFDAPTDSHSAILSCINQTLEQLPLFLPSAVRKITITFNQLSSKALGLQLDLFTERIRHEKISSAIFTIRSRHGFEALQLGNTIRIDRQTAKEQPGFGKIRDQF